MAIKIDKTMLQPLLVDLQNKMKELPNEWNKPDASALQSFQGKFHDVVYKIPEPAYAVVVLLKIQVTPDGSKTKVVPPSNLQLIQFPKELSQEILLFLPVEDLLRMRFVCNYYKDLIDSSPELQTKIAHHFLVKRQPQVNIAIDDLKMDLTHHKLSVEINGNFTLWKFINGLSRATPWINHFIVNDGKPNELAELFKQLKQSKRLVSLHLLNCQVDSKAISALQSLIPSDDLKTKSPFLYLCNLTPDSCELPSQLSTSSPNVAIIDANKANEYSIERFLTKESDLIELKELNSQVENENLSAEFILKKMQEINPIIKAGIISSIWHSKLTPTTGPTTLFSKNAIQKKVFDFVLDQPHHPAVKAAVKKNLDQYK